MASTQTHDEVLIQRVHIGAAKQAQVAVDRDWDGQMLPALRKARYSGRQVA